MSLRKAVSPLLSTVLLVLFVIVIGGVVINWLSDYSQETTGQVDDVSSQVVDCSTESLEVYELTVTLNTSDNISLVTALINNKGTNASVGSVLVFDVDAQSCSLSGDTVIVNGGISSYSSSGCSIFNVSNDCAELDRVLISTNCGRSYVFDSVNDTNCFQVS